jgi:hypothetical protein
MVFRNVDVTQMVFSYVWHVCFHPYIKSEGILQIIQAAC